MAELIVLPTALALQPGPLQFSPVIVLPAVANPFGVRGPAGEALRLVTVGAWGLVEVLALASATALVIRLRRARGDERQQLKWLAYASAMVVLCAGVYYATYAAFGPPMLFSPLGQAVSDLVVAAFAGLPLAVGAAILKYRLYDIDLLIHRTLVYGTLTVSIVAVYVVVVGTLGALMQTSGNLGISLLATGLVAVLFQPLRERLQRGVNHLLYGQRDEPYRVLSGLMQRLEGTLAPEAVLPSIVQTVREALKLPYAAIALRQADNLVLAGASGEPTMEVLRLPLVYQHESVGELRLGARGRGEAWSPADRQLLGDLARQAGVAAHAVRLAAELQHSRERLVSAREEERRRLWRDLHDELAPTLAALALTAATARDRATSDPSTRALLDDLYA